ncbi:MAG: histidine phosphatase family protein [Myxococcales bacterium]|nr:histidine phosphatase family protein [Myxococcales bacterium]MDH3483666.1 histidine phosphatase family protein [Myxococcales bacterium]
MMTLEVCLVRHAESVSNAKGVWQGHGDAALSDRGRTQTDALERALAEERYDFVISSDLRRAADTARAAGGRLELDPAWREIDVGDWEGMTMEEVVERFPEQIAALKERRAFAVGGGESWPEVFTRADDALRAVRDRMPDGGRVIVFTHGGIIAAILAGLVGARDRWPWPLGRMRNTGRSTLRFSGNRVALVGHNDDSHIPNHHRKTYQPRSDQTVLKLVSSDRADQTGNTAGLDFNSAIKVARAKGAGGVMSVLGSGREIAALVQASANPSVKDFRFVEPVAGASTDLLISQSHQMLLDYGVPQSQI